MATSLGLKLAMIFVGSLWGFLAMPRVLYVAWAVFPKFKEIQDLTKLESTHLLYIILRSPALWLAFTGILTLAVFQFFPDCLSAFVVGFVGSLVLLGVESYRDKKQKQGSFLEQLKREVSSPLLDPADKFPPFSPRQMRMANWRTNGTNLTGYLHLSYECSACSRHVTLKEAKVCFRGNRNRFIVECKHCRQPTIIRISISLLAEPQVITEARMPEQRKQPVRRREEKRTANAPTDRSSL